MANRFLSARATLIILTGLNFLNYLDRYIIAAVLPHIKQEMKLNDGELGRIATIFMLGYFITSPIFGYLGDRGSRKWLIAIGIFVWSLGTVLSGFAGTLVALLCCRILVGVGEASYASISPGTFRTRSPPKKETTPTRYFTWPFRSDRRWVTFWVEKFRRSGDGVTLFFGPAPRGFCWR